MRRKKYTDTELYLKDPARFSREWPRRRAAQRRREDRQFTKLLVGLAKLLTGRPRRRKKVFHTARRRKVAPRLAHADYRHGLTEFIPGTSTKLLSDPARLTPLFCKGRATTTEADQYLIDFLTERYRDQPFPRGYLDAGRLNRLLGDELEFTDEKNCDPVSRNTMLKLT